MKNGFREAEYRLMMLLMWKADEHSTPTCASHNWQRKKGGTLEGWTKETWHQALPLLRQTVTGVNSKASESDTNWIVNVLPIAQGRLRMIRRSVQSKCTVQTFPHNDGVKPFLKVKSTNSVRTPYKNETYIHTHISNTNFQRVPSNITRLTRTCWYRWPFRLICGHHIKEKCISAIRQQVTHSSYHSPSCSLFS